ncbi:MAG: hypothetical protein WAY93_00390 [Atopobiaceae bacterium]|jgi:hypothetical protein|nr:hypothetical protein [Atopobiaceae bacterium]
MRPVPGNGAGGDSKATSGQGNVERMLAADGVAYSTATLDATWDADRINSGAQAMLDEGHACNFPSWVAGTVMSANPGKNMEHMVSFDPAYKVDAARTWLYRQSR